MTKAELAALILTIIFGGLLVAGLFLLRGGQLNEQTFWTAGVIGIMAVYGAIAALGVAQKD